MPRKNRHCVEWYDKYSSKNKELMKKFNTRIYNLDADIARAETALKEGTN